MTIRLGVREFIYACVCVCVRVCVFMSSDTKAADRASLLTLYRNPDTAPEDRP